MHVLYRKYRPKTFAEVVGQNHIKVTLANEIGRNQLAHAYLFVGPRGTGKTTIARLVARAVNCMQRKEGSAEPCNECLNCIHMLREQSLDVIEVDAATHTDVDNVRDNIITNAHVPPYYKNGYKVFIIDEVHMLSKHAFNALLKTIEEPPAHALFILATTDVHKVPETIISRCQRFDFKKIPQKLIVERLADLSAREGVAVPGPILQGIARQAGGFLRDAESLLGQVIALAEKGKVSEELASIIIQPTYWQQIDTLLTYLKQRNVSGALEFIHSTSNEGIDAEQLLEDAIEFIRQLLLKKTIGPSYAPNVEEATAQAMTVLIADFSVLDLKRMLEIFLKQQQMARYMAIPQLPLELACIEFCNEGVEGLRLISAMETPLQTTAETNGVKNEQPELAGEIARRWPDILENVKANNHSLAVFLKGAHPLSVVDSVITLGFKFDFHADKVREEKNKRATQKALTDVLGKVLIIDCVVDTNYTDNHKNFNGSREKEVKDVLDVLGGGEVV